MANAGSPAKGKRRIMRSFKINEISGVDVPAQEGALAVIMKRKHVDDTDKDKKSKSKTKTDEELAKNAAMTNAVDGHTHLVYTGSFSGEDRLSGSTSWEDDHAHPWIKDALGNIVIGEMNGHTHEVAVTTKSAGEVPGTIVKKEDPSVSTKSKPSEPTIEDLQKQLERSTKVGELNDVAKAHFSGLSEVDQDAFLAKSADERSAVLDDISKAASDADPVVYKTADGLELRKSDGMALVAMAKSNDALRKSLSASNDANANADLVKRANDELSHFPGTVETRVALLKSVDGIEDATERADAMNALKAQNTALGKSFDVRGHGGHVVEAGSADQKLDALAKTYQQANTGVSLEKAFTAVLDTAEGAALYEQTLS